MKKALIVAALGVLLGASFAPTADASSFMQIDVSGSTLSCNNSNAAGVVACGAAGFTTALGSNSIQFTGTINGVSFGVPGQLVGVQLVGNSPGNPLALAAFILDTKTDVVNGSGAARTVTIDVAQNGFSIPAGPAFLSGSQDANWLTSTAGDTQNFQVWERNDNLLVVPGGTATAITPTCTSPGGLTQSCSQEAFNVPLTATAPYSVTSREIITLAPGTTANYSGIAAVTANPIPEPGTVILLGTGMLLVAGRQFRNRRKK